MKDQPARSGDRDTSRGDGAQDRKLFTCSVRLQRIDLGQVTSIRPSNSQQFATRGPIIDRNRFVNMESRPAGIGDRDTSRGEEGPQELKLFTCSTRLQKQRIGLGQVTSISSSNSQQFATAGPIIDLVEPPPESSLSLCDQGSEDHTIEFVDLTNETPEELPPDGLPLTPDGNMAVDITIEMPKQLPPDGLPLTRDGDIAGDMGRQNVFPTSDTGKEIPYDHIQEAMDEHLNPKEIPVISLEGLFETFDREMSIHPTETDEMVPTPVCTRAVSTRLRNRKRPKKPIVNRARTRRGEKKIDWPEHLNILEEENAARELAAAKRRKPFAREPDEKVERASASDILNAEVARLDLIIGDQIKMEKDWQAQLNSDRLANLPVTINGKEMKSISKIKQLIKSARREAIDRHARFRFRESRISAGVYDEFDTNIEANPDLKQFMTAIKRKPYKPMSIYEHEMFLRNCDLMTSSAIAGLTTLSSTPDPMGRSAAIDP